MYKFDRVESLAEMKEICFFIKAINEAKTKNKFNTNDLMTFKEFLNKKYNLEIPLSKLYLFVEKIYYLNNKKEVPTNKELEAIVAEYIDFQKKALKKYELDIIKAELNLSDKKYNVGDYGFKSAKDLTKDISITKKVYNSYNGWILLASAAIALFLGTGMFLFIGAFFPTLLTYFISKPQEVILLLLIVAVLTYTMYVVLDYANRKKTWHLKAQIDAYNKYRPQIEIDYNKLIEAKRIYTNKQVEFSINGIEFSEKLIYNYLTMNDRIDIASYSTIAKKYTKFQANESINKPTKTSVILSKKEQDINWNKSSFSKIEKDCMNKELIYRMTSLVKVIKENKASTISVAKAVSDLYCNELSVEKRKNLITDVDSKYELSKNYLNLIKKIEEFEKMSYFNAVVQAKNDSDEMVVKAEEMLSFKQDLGSMCDRIEKAYSLGLVEENKYKSYKIVKDMINSLDGSANVEQINTRVGLVKLYVKLYEDLQIYDILN